MKHKATSLLVFLVLVQSCSPNFTAVEVPATPPILNKPTEVIRSTPVPTEEFHAINLACPSIEVLDNVPPLSGLLLQSRQSNQLLKSVIGDPVLEVIAWVDTNRGFLVSPGGEHYAYVSLDDTLEVAGRDGTKVSIGWHQSWRNLVQWIDESTILIGKLANEDFGRDGLISLNINTNEIQEVLIDYQDFWDIMPLPSWGLSTFVLSVLDKDLALAAIASYPLEKGEEGTIVLWNLEAGEVIGKIAGLTYFGNQPKWSPSGSGFLTNNSLTTTYSVESDIVDDQELFFVTREGQIKKLTFLNDFYSDVSIGAYSWSMDGDKVAFWVEARGVPYPDPYADSDSYLTQRLFVVDFNTGETIGYCLPGDEYSGISEPPIWSPEGEYVVIENRLSEFESKVFLIDVETSTTVMISENAVPVGWIIE